MNMVRAAEINISKEHIPVTGAFKILALHSKFFLVDFGVHCAETPPLKLVIDSKK